ncbi:VacJ family lipoprotein [Sphingomonas sp. 28-63-12]|uniref:MlaA family lipoprotein n=1 Tax=Sphingomonas sp. 28-63-12 TaxID=1970434 RepID=UPI000BCA1775|nr:MAG: hypothetical protein B7Y47_12755 [Sphingomonas sp. 28-63-12]
MNTPLFVMAMMLAGPAPDATDRAVTVAAPLQVVPTSDELPQAVLPAPAMPKAEKALTAAALLQKPAPSVTAPPRDPGEIVVNGRKRIPGDPFARFNARSFKITQAVDKAVVGPAALAYQENVPSPIRSGLRNALSNLHDPIVFINFLLQLKPGKAAETAGRFAINSTIGVGGLFDMAKRRPFHLPRRANGLADTLGYYGVKPGPFFYLPLIGSTTVRDFAGSMIDRFLLPFAFGKPFNKIWFTLPVGVISQLDHRAEFDDELHALHDNSPDPYAATRKLYLDRRQAEIDGLHSRHKTTAEAGSTPGPLFPIIREPSPVITLDAVTEKAPASSPSPSIEP